MKTEVYGIIAWLLIAIGTWFFCGCSFKVEIGYHGRSGIADHHETALAAKGK